MCRKSENSEKLGGVPQNFLGNVDQKPHFATTNRKFSNLAEFRRIWTYSNLNLISNRMIKFIFTNSVWKYG